jgi:hypothetical protein
MIEVIEINPSELQEYLNKGYEFLCVNTYSGVNEVPIREEIPVTRMVTSNNTGSYYNYEPTYQTKHYPVATITTKFIVKRSQAAKLLYEKSLKNENNN